MYNSVMDSQWKNKENGLPDGSMLQFINSIMQLNKDLPKHIISLKDFSYHSMNNLFELANRLRHLNPKITKDLLAGKVIGTLFYQPSTRTYSSFHAALLKLGASVIGFADPDSTRANDYYQETLEDVVQSIGQLSDLLVLRHNETGIAMRIAKISPVSLISAGDGYNEHPTQALGDIWTMILELGELKGRRIGFVGNLELRSFRSILIGLSNFKIEKLVFLPSDGGSVPLDIQKVFAEKNIKWELVENIEDMLPKVDLIETIGVRHPNYSMQCEKPNIKSLNGHTPNKFIINFNKLKNYPNVPILHPGPRMDEISSDVDGLPQIAYFRQVKNGMWLRMALLLGLLFVKSKE